MQGPGNPLLRVAPRRLWLGHALSLADNLPFLLRFLSLGEGGENHDQAAVSGKGWSRASLLPRPLHRAARRARTRRSGVRRDAAAGRAQRSKLGLRGYGEMPDEDDSERA